MKKKNNILPVILLLTITSFATAFGQTHRFIYNLKFKSKKEGEYKKDFIVTDINKTHLKSYSYDFLVYDSINKSQKSTYFASPVFEDRYIKDIKTNTTTNFENFLENVYAYETTDTIAWKIENDFKKIDSFKVQRATAEFGGRNWTAWFTQEIPLPYGPYKFGGLPGLILEVQDKDEEFVFTFNRNINLSTEYNTTGFLESFYGIKPVIIKYSKIEKLKKDYYNDPYREFKLGQKKGNFQDDKGNTIEKPDYNKMSKIVQENIENNNNHVEKFRNLNYKNN